MHSSLMEIISNAYLMLAALVTLEVALTALGLAAKRELAHHTLSRRRRLEGRRRL